jgi:hypothetical protein
MTCLGRRQAGRNLAAFDARMEVVGEQMFEVRASSLPAAGRYPECAMADSG